MTHETRSQYWLNLKDYRVTKFPKSIKVKLIGPQLSIPVARPGNNTIKGFSKASGRRFKAAYEERPQDFKTFITFAFPQSFKATKEQLNELWKALAKKAKKQGCSYLWVREAHRSGKPHYHILFTGNDTAARVFVSTARSIVYSYLSELEKKAANLWMIKIRTIQQLVNDRKKLVTYVMKTLKYMYKDKAIEFDKTTGEIIEGFRYWGRNYGPRDTQVAHGLILTESDLDYIRYQIALAKFFPKVLYFEPEELELSGTSLDYQNFPIEF